MRRKPSQDTVKIDQEVIHRARVVAAFRGISLAAYLTEKLREPVTGDFREAAKQAAKEQ